MDKKKKYLFSFFKFYKFLLLSLPILARVDFLKNSKFCIQFLHNLHGQKSHFQVFIFDFKFYIRIEDSLRETVLATSLLLY